MAADYLLYRSWVRHCGFRFEAIFDTPPPSLPPLTSHFSEQLTHSNIKNHAGSHGYRSTICPSTHRTIRYAFSPYPRRAFSLGRALAYIFLNLASRSALKHQSSHHTCFRSWPVRRITLRLIDGPNRGRPTKNVLHSQRNTLKR